MSRVRLATLTSLALAVACSACASHPGDLGTDEGAHSDGDYAADDNPYYWADVEYAAVANVFPPRSWEAPLADDHPLTVRIQSWIDRYDAIVRAAPRASADGGTALRAPKPRAKVVPSTARYNAWVQRVPLCTGDRFAGEGNASSVIGMNPKWLETTPRCAEMSSPPGASFVDVWNDTKPACSLERDASGLHARGPEACARSLPGARIATSAPAPFVFFSTDYIAAYSEPVVARIVAHELAHYYRAHGSPLRKQHYDFWYESESGEPRRLPEAEVTELRRIYDDVQYHREDASYLVPGARYRRQALRFVVNDLLPRLKERSEPDFVCAAARDRLRGIWWLALQHGAAPTASETADYLAFEGALDECAARLHLGDAGGADALDARALRTATDVHTLREALDRRERDVNESEARRDALVQRIRDNRLGLYTTEQEADEIAFELATKVGFTPDEILAGWVEQLRADGARDPFVREAAEKCVPWLRDGFTVDDGRGGRTPVFVPLGDIEEPHHDTCYRAFNAWRELSRHRYVVGERAAPLSPSWDDIRALAQTEGQRSLENP